MRFSKSLGFLLIISSIMSSCNHQKTDEGYIGPSVIKITDGKMSPEALLALGRISDPQLSPDAKSILYGVSYTSVEDNRSCRNLFVCSLDGTDKIQLTREGHSVSNARWLGDASGIMFIQDGQIWKASLNKKRNALVGKRCLSNVPAGVSEFKLSPDKEKVIYVSSVHGAVKTPKDSDPALDKAVAYETEDLMYRHWDHWVTEVPHSFVASLDTVITPDNSTDILAGESELYELPSEPFSGIEQLCWSPDGKFIAYSCKKEVGERYAFSTNSEIYIYNVQTKGAAPIKNGGGYDTDPAWSPDGKSIVWISMARDGYEADKTRLMIADLEYDADNELPLVSSVRDLTAGFKYNAAAPVWDPDSKTIYFNALAEGLQGLFSASPSVQTVAEADASAPGSATASAPVGQNVITRITGEDKWFDFASPFAVVTVDKDSKALLTGYESMEFPTELVAVTILSDAADSVSAYSCANSNADSSATITDKINGDTIITVLKADCPLVSSTVTYSQLTHENDHILSQLTGYKTEARIMKTVDGKDMLTWVLYPPEFDSTKTYPSILITLGGPQGTLSQGWSYRWCYRLMAAQGYVVVLPNRRGTTAFGPEWTEEISGDYIGLNMQDYLTAARQLKAEPFVGKMAACGASYGGYSVYYLAGIHGNVFDCFIAHAGIFNEEELYYTTEEMWFPTWDNGGLHEFEADPRVGTPECPVGAKGDGETFGGIRQGGSPWSNAPKAVKHYANSPHKLVENWHTPILCIHGGNDFRIPYEQGMAAFNAARMMGVPSKLIVFPDECHWILKPQNALYWHRSYFEWLDRWCKNGGAEKR